MGNAPEPDTKHWLHRDLYTHIKWGRVSPPETDEEGWMGGRTHTMQVGDSMLVGHTLLTIDSLRAVLDSEKPNRGLLQKDLAIAACVSLKNKERDTPHQPLYIVRDSTIIPDLYEAEEYGIKMRIETFDPQAETLEMTVWEHESVRRDFVVMQAPSSPDQCAVARVHPHGHRYVHGRLGPMENRYQIPVPWLIVPSGHRVRQRQRRHITWASLGSQRRGHRRILQPPRPCSTGIHQCGCAVLQAPADIDVAADHALMAVRDEVVFPLIEQLPSHLTPVHFSGALRNPDKGGVIWCAQSIQPNNPEHVGTIPMVITANDEAEREALTALAGRISNQLYPTTEEKRQRAT